MENFSPFNAKRCYTLPFNHGLYQPGSTIMPLPFVLTPNLQGGMELRIAENTVVDKPIALIFSGRSESMHHRVILENGAKATMIHAILDPQAELKQQALHIDLSPRAELEFYHYQPELAEAVVHTHYFIHQETHSQLRGYYINLGGKSLETTISAQLKGEYAHLKLTGFYKADHQQLVRQTLAIEHCASHTQSQQFYKGWAQARGQAYFDGKIVVAKGAQKVEAHQTNRNLLLSKTASVETKPQLEIYNDDVICSHGATVGDLDEEALFYLQSRGVAYQTARHILMEAFANEIFNQLPESWFLGEVDHV